MLKCLSETESRIQDYISETRIFQEMYLFKEKVGYLQYKVLVVWLVVKALGMELLSGILGQFIGVGVIALLIVFQPEIRRFLLLIGRSRTMADRFSWKGLLSLKFIVPSQRRTFVGEIENACKRFSKSKTGALLVIAKTSKLQFFANTGMALDGMISADLLISIFHKKSPLHDGAVIIADNRIVAARCILPVTENIDLPSWAGLRHRSAVGITDHSDAIALVVSEETGEIAYAENGELHAKIDNEQLHQIVTKALMHES